MGVGIVTSPSINIKAMAKMGLGKLHGKVHCHVCPLKDRCDVGDDEVSYRYHHYHDDRYNPRFGPFIPAKSEDEKVQHTKDFDKMEHITTLCPLNKVIE